MSSNSQDLESNITDHEDHQNYDDIEKEAKEISITKEFQENVIKFVKIDDLMRKKQRELSELRSQRKPCEEFILKYLDQIGESVIEISNGKLRKNKSETKVPLNQDIIKDAIKKKINDPKDIDEIIKLMDQLRPKNVRVNLKRTSHRATKIKE